MIRGNSVGEMSTVATPARKVAAEAMVLRRERKRRACFMSERGTLQMRSSFLFAEWLPKETKRAKVRT
jgi:hypothetical protein